MITDEQIKTFEESLTEPGSVLDKGRLYGFLHALQAVSSNALRSGDTDECRRLQGHTERLMNKYMGRAA